MDKVSYESTNRKNQIANDDYHQSDHRIDGDQDQQKHASHKQLSKQPGLEDLDHERSGQNSNRIRVSADIQGNQLSGRSSSNIQDKVDTQLL